MTIENLLALARNFYATHTALALGILAFLALVTFLRPKEMFKLYITLLLLAAALYMISLFAGTVKSGSSQKDRMIYKTREAIGD